MEGDEGRIAPERGEVRLGKVRKYGEEVKDLGGKRGR